MSEPTTSPEPSVRQRILAALLERLEAINVGGNFATNAGDTVTIGETPELGEGDPATAINIVVLETTPRFQGVNVYEEFGVEIQALARADLEQPHIAAELVLADIVRAVETEDRTLGGTVRRTIELGSVRTVPRAPGMSTVGIGVVYRLPYVRAFGRP